MTMRSTPTTLKLMNGLFDDRMNGLASAVEGSPDETPTVKTYILENIGENRAGAKSQKFLADLFSRHPSSSMRRLKCLTSSRDPILHLTGRYGREEFAAYVDFSSPRYLKLHSMAKSGVADDVVAGWTAHEAAIDQAWFYDQFLESCAARGQFRGLKIEYSSEPLQPRDSEDDLEDSVTVRQSGRDVATMLSLLRTSPAFANKSALSMVRLRYPDGNTDQRVTSEVRYDGRISARGNSFDRHAQLVDDILTGYAAEIARVEAEFSSGVVALAGGWRPRLKPLRIDLDPIVADVGTFCDHLFSATYPFRLTGDVERLTDDHFSVQAIDLHTGQLFPFEITQKHIWLSLPEGTCGNTFFRLFTNLQRHHSRLVRCDQVFGDSGK